MLTPAAAGLRPGPTPATARAEGLPGWRRRLLEQRVAEFFQRRPASLGVGLAGRVPAAAPRRLEGVDVRQPGWWREAGLPRGAGAPPLLLLAEGLAADLPAPPAAALLWAVGEHAPPGSLLLIDAPARAPIARWLADPEALATLHPRLRVDDRHRLHDAAGWAGRWRARLAELRHGRPLWALYEVGVDV